MTSPAPLLPVSLADFASLLVIKPSSLGDIVHTLPAVHAIRQAHPHLKIRWLANTEWMPLIEGSPILDEVIPFPRKTFRGLAGLARAWRWGRQFRHMQRETPEIILDFQGLFRSGLSSKARGSSPVIGLSDAREGAGRFYTHTVPVDAGAHAVDRYLELPRALGVEVPPEEVEFSMPAGIKPQVWPLQEDWIVVHPWSRGEGKSLSDAALQTLCDALAPHPIALVGVMKDAVIPRGAHVCDLSNRTNLAELIWILRGARFCISVDSGPMHMAAAVNDCTLGIHTWTDPRKVGPYNSRAWVWKAGRIAHRNDFSPAECLQDTKISPEDTFAMGRFVLSRLQKD